MVSFSFFTFQVLYSTEMSIILSFTINYFLLSCNCTCTIINLLTIPITITYLLFDFILFFELKIELYSLSTFNTSSIVLIKFYSLFNLNYNVLIKIIEKKCFRTISQCMDDGYGWVAYSIDTPLLKKKIRSVKTEM